MLFRILGIVIAGYGLYVFVTRDLAAYMFLRTQFVFLDYSESPPLFLYRLSGHDGTVYLDRSLSPRDPAEIRKEKETSSDERKNSF